MTLDVICVIDPRFAGGTAAAMASDINAFLDAGLEVGLVEVKSPYLSDVTEARSKAVAKIREDNRLHVIHDTAYRVVKARAAFLHHPMTFFYGLDQPIQLQVEKSFMVAHHLPFRGDGSLQYDPIVTSWRAYRATGAKPIWAPVSGICRQQLQSFAPLIRLASQDWPNVFDVSAWTPTREIFTGDHITIGRHGRADLLKWPETAAEIAASLPSLPNTRIRVMGAPTAELDTMGVDRSSWTVIPFDAEPVAQFLDQLDVFIYHFHPNSSESFGRTVAEAMLMGAVCILDPRLEPTFGDLALYCLPDETAAMIGRLRADPAAARSLADRARNSIAARHSIGSVPGRLNDLMAGKTADNQTEERVVSPLEVLRKTAGMMRRREYFLSQLGARQ
ncbi:glycosyltransferase [Yoonia maritima]|uniref:glycosyltransferase family protein n=1 Tax=Yoonia maritima TaxID=1435347 RepID=UPI003736D758